LPDPVPSVGRTGRETLSTGGTGAASETFSVLRDHRQRWSREDVEMQGDGGEYAAFSVYFKVDVEGGTAAFERWVSRVESMGGVSKIGHASLRGSDETNLHCFDEETEETYGKLDEETLAQIDQLFEDRARARESG